MTHLLRLVLSAASGAVLVTGLFAAMGKATAPRLNEEDLMRLDDAVPGVDTQLVSVASARGSGLTSDGSPPVVPIVDWGNDQPVHPGFDVETRVDANHLEPDLVVLSRPLSTTDAVAERRWWKNLAHRLGDDED